MQRTMSYFDLLDAFREEGCPVCRIGLAAVQRYIGAVDHESVGDPGFRADVVASLGFCNVHAHQWLDQAHLLGTASIYVDVLSRLGQELRALPLRRSALPADVAERLGVHAGRDDRRVPLRPNGRCPVCRVLTETEEMVVQTLLATLSEPGFAAAYAASAGLCLPHLRLAFDRAGDDAAIATLRDVAIAAEERFLSQLREVIRRHDYRFMGEPVGEERGAAGRAVRHVAGAPGIGRPPHR